MGTRENFFLLLWMRRGKRPTGDCLKRVLSYFGIAKGLKCLKAGGFNVGRILASQNKIIFSQKQLDFLEASNYHLYGSYFHSDYSNCITQTCQIQLTTKGSGLLPLLTLQLLQMSGSSFPGKLLKMTVSVFYHVKDNILDVSLGINISDGCWFKTHSCYDLWPPSRILSF